MGNRWILLSILTIALAMGVWSSLQVNQPKEISALYYQPERKINPFQLLDHNGQPFNNESLQNKWTLIFTGYTYCPDICPTTMAKFSQHYQALKEISKDIQVVLISVDPQRDSAERLKEYASYFNPEFIAATHGHKDLFPFIRNIGLMYSMVDADNEDYLVDHSASIVLTNPRGNVQAIFKPVHAAGQVANVDFNALKMDLPTILGNYK